VGILFTGQTVFPGLSAEGKIKANKKDTTGRLTEACGRIITPYRQPGNKDVGRWMVKGLA